jgi:hypothetical protein
MHVDACFTKRYFRARIANFVSTRVPRNDTTMNAMFREEDEVPVISNDAIEAQLINLRDGLQEVRAAQPVLQARIDKTNDKIDAVNASLSARIDAVDAKLSDKIDAVNARLSDKIDAVDAKLSDKIGAVDAKLSDKIDAVDAKLSDKIDVLKAEIFARFDKQSEEIKALVKDVAWIHISVKVMLAILGLCVSAAVIVNALRTLRWI